MPKPFSYHRGDGSVGAVNGIHRGLERLNDDVSKLRAASDEAVEAVLAARQRDEERVAARLKLNADLRQSRNRGPA
jgi:hypothetical protein